MTKILNHPKRKGVSFSFENGMPNIRYSDNVGGQEIGLFFNNSTHMYEHFEKEFYSVRWDKHPYPLTGFDKELIKEVNEWIGTHANT